MTENNKISNGSNKLGKSEKKEPVAPDGGYSWVILTASFITNVIVDGVCFAFGIFYLEFLDYFEESRGKTAWIGSILNGTYMIMGPFAGAFSKVFGGRSVSIVGALWACCAFICCTFANNVNQMILTYGVLGGIGFGLLYLPSILMVGFYFDRKRALATGIATCGSGIGTFVLAPLCNFLLYLYGWRGAQWIVAGIVLNGAVMGALYRPLTEREMAKYKKKWRLRHFEENIGIPELEKISVPTGTQNGAEKNGASNGSVKGTKEIPKATKSGSIVKKFAASVTESMDITVLKNPVFDIYALSCVLCMAALLVCMYYSGFFVPFTYLPDKAIGLGYSQDDAALLLSILGITNTFGRIIAGWLSDRPWMDCLLLNNVCLIVGGLATVLCPFCVNFTMLAVYALVFGMCIAAFVCLRSIILIDLIGLETLTSSFGLIVLSQGISTFFGAPLAGFLYDMTGTYNLSFYIAGAFITMAGVINLPLRRFNQYKDKRVARKSNDSSSSNNSESLAFNSNIDS